MSHRYDSKRAPQISPSDHSHVATMLRKLGPKQRQYFYLCQPYLPNERDQIGAIREIATLDAVTLTAAIAAMKKRLT